MSNDSSEPVSPLIEGGKHHRSGLWYAIVGTISIAVLYFVSQLVASQLIGGIVVSLSPLSLHWSSEQALKWLQTSTYAQFSYLALAELLMFVGLVRLLRWFKWTWRTIGLIKPTVGQIGLGIASAVPYYILYLVVVVVVSALIPSLNINQNQEIGFDNTRGVVELVLTFIGLVVLPPLVEELTMRGFLYSSLRKSFSRVISALLVSGIFGAAHLAEGGAAGPLWIGAIDTFVLSLVLVYLREKTGNLWAGISLHAVKNGVAYFALYIAPLLHLNIH